MASNDGVSGPDRAHQGDVAVPPHASEPKSKDRRKSNPAQRTKSDPAQQYEEILGEFLELRSKGEAKQASVTASFGRLAKALARMGAKATQAIASLDSDSASSELRELALNLACSHDVIVATNGACAALFDSDARRDLLVLARSSWISSGRFREQLPLTQMRRSLLPPQQATQNPLVADDALGRWNPGSRDENLDAWRAVANVDVSPPDLSLPVAIELATRMQLLSLALLDPRHSEIKDAKERALGRRALDRVLDEMSEMLAGGSLFDRDAWELCMRIVEFVGPNGAVWGALETRRKRLLTVPADLPSHFDAALWAEAVAATWYGSSDSIALLEQTDDKRLAYLLRAALDRPRSGLQKHVRKIFVDRTRSVGVRGNLADALAWVAEHAPGEREWIDPESARHRAMSPSEPAIAAATLAPTNELTTPSFIEQLRAAEPRVAIVAAAVAGRRVGEAKQEQRVEAKRRALMLAQEVMNKLTEIPGLLRASLGIVDEETNDRVQRQLANLKRVTAAVSEVEAVRVTWPVRFEADAYPWDGADLPEGLRDLEFSGARSVEESGRLRSALKARLIQETRNDGTAIPALVLSLASMPPEAVGLAMEVGVGLRHATLLSGVAPIIRDQPWARRMWLDVIVRIGPIDTLPVPIDDDIAQSTLESLIEMLTDDTSGSTEFEHMRREGDDALRHTMAALDGIIGRVQRVKDHLAGSLTNGAPDRA